MTQLFCLHGITRQESREQVVAVCESRYNNPGEHCRRNSFLCTLFSSSLWCFVVGSLKMDFAFLSHKICGVLRRTNARSGGQNIRFASTSPSPTPRGRLHHEFSALTKRYCADESLIRSALSLPSSAPLAATFASETRLGLPRPERHNGHCSPPLLTAPPPRINARHELWVRMNAVFLWDSSPRTGKHSGLASSLLTQLPSR
ncbi:hypothetical protein J6590_013824 [Homalodisca vitripennis]|nr:hypothetical protein J6590_013824 [Homalodisca vitripennis]